MPRHKLECEFWIPASIDEAWDFGSQPANLAGITPPIYGLKVDIDGPLRAGLRMTITMSPLGVPIPKPWVALIESVQDQGPVREFIDTQESGPFRYWRHTHRFSAGTKIALMQPGTWVRDLVEYELPFEILGEAANFLFARKNIESMFAYRRKKTREIFGIQPQ